MHAETRGSGGMPPLGNFLKNRHRMHFCLQIFYILPLDIWLSAAFANGKVCVGSDNQAYDAPSHNCMHDRIIMLKLENFEI